jgi:hypothetical protein
MTQKNYYRPSDKVRTVASMIEQMAVSSQEVTPLHLRTWTVALRVPVMGLELVERELEARPRIEATIGRERLTAEDAGQLVLNAGRLIERLAVAAMIADREPVPTEVINAAAHGLLDIVDALAHGVQRPSEAAAAMQTLITQPEIGA